MTDCTERHPAGAGDGLAGDGLDEALDGYRSALAGDGLAGDGQEGMPKEGRA